MPLAEPRAKEEVALRAPAAAPPAPPVVTSGEAEQPALARANAAKPESPSAEAVGGERRRNEVADSATSAGSTAASVPPRRSAATGKTRSEVDVKDADELRAEDWLEKIIKLRKAGRHDEADAELKRFRERYPQVQVPTDALPPTGTR